MSDPTSDLLDDLLEDGSRTFRDKSLAHTLSAVHRRKWIRRVKRSGFVALIVAGFLFLRPTPDIQTLVENLSPTSSPLNVHTRALREDQIVRTRPASVAIVTSSPGNLAIIRTERGRAGYQEISDGQLLALLGDREAAIFRSPEFGTRLIIKDESVLEGFPVN